MQWTIDEAIGLPIILLVMIIISIILRKLLCNKSDKIRSYPLKIIALLIILLEVAKQIENIVVDFSTWAIPLHYCSLFVFFIPLAQFGNEKIKKIFKPVAISCALTMALGFYTAPALIIGDNALIDLLDSFGEFHTVIFHHLAILYAFLSIALTDYTPKKNDCKYVLIVMVSYFMIAIPFSYILDTNFCNILETVIPIVKPIQAFIGQPLYLVSLTVVVAGGTALMCYLYYLVYNKITKKESN